MKHRVVTGIVALCLVIGGLIAGDKTDFQVSVSPHGPVGMCKCENPATGKPLYFRVNASGGSFEPNTGKVISGKRHGIAYWAPMEGENTADHFTATLPNLPQSECAYVLCNGQWDEQIDTGDGGKDGNTVQLNWLAQLIGQGNVCVFLCHQYPGDPDGNNAILKGAQYAGKLFGRNDEDYFIIEIGAGNVADNIYKIGSALKDKNVKENTVTALYSVGHGAPGELGVGYTDETDTQRVIYRNFGISDGEPSCKCDEYVEQFAKYLKEGEATVYLHHCSSGVIASGRDPESTMVHAIATALSNKFPVVGFTGKAATGDATFGPDYNSESVSDYVFFIPNKSNKK